MGSCGGGGAGGGCQSECFRDREGDEEDSLRTEDLKRCSGSCSGDQSPANDGLYNNLCGACFRFSLYGKFKVAVTSNGMISPTDKVLVALEFAHEMQLKAQKSWDASKDQALPVFGVGAAFIDESIPLRPSKVVQKAIEEMRFRVSQLTPPPKVFHDGTGLNALLETISDATGKEDLLSYLRMLSLQKIALDNGYSKLVLGSCTTTIACHILSATVKGQGYSLPADIQYVDARWEIPVVLPLRSCLAEELQCFATLMGNHEIHQVFDQPCSGINNLVSSFIARVQEENPSRARTILRTAEKLRPFHFNRLSENLSYEMLPSRVRRKLQTAANAEFTPSELLCPICGGPLTESDVTRLKSTVSKSSRRHEAFAAHCCQSCCSQILPKELPSLEHFYSLLPDQIEDCLLSSDED
ncbi:unnamed protein product [Spirodela intermedia]|uniref:Cytoplasmic tRNA 2-thiolation protein 2 n=1 Tax=Spirodela intermedia TaxID=51605 RepID=A0A7I8JB59_SPIIN|nr:unnamed protein product [Spirodela intermedia]CAA6667407.1 unnamed protein product [Spirodela intermedia]